MANKRIIMIFYYLSFPQIQPSSKKLKANDEKMKRKEIGAFEEYLFGYLRIFEGIWRHLWKFEDDEENKIDSVAIK